MVMPSGFDVDTTSDPRFLVSLAVSPLTCTSSYAVVRGNSSCCVRTTRARFHDDDFGGAIRPLPPRLSSASLDRLIQFLLAILLVVDDMNVVASLDLMIVVVFVVFEHVFLDPRRGLLTICIFTWDSHVRSEICSSKMKVTRE